MNNTKIGVVGLGYVGLPVAVSFSKKYDVVGFDINEERISELRLGIDRTNEVSPEKLILNKIQFTSDATKLSDCHFIIIAVPTPIDERNKPNLTPILAASQTVANILRPGTIVVYESTVYPGLTEEECIPVLERFSKLVAGRDFFVGYSPERINPGDPHHKFETIQKVVAGQTEEITEMLAVLYGSVVTAGVHKAPSIQVAEAAKVIENTQRDVNIALMNELALLFNELNINTADVLKAANTKWNFLDFKPGLVGGHCIGVDPYYLTTKAEQVGYVPNIILSSRKLNDSMPDYIAERIVKQLIANNKKLNEAVVTVLGVTFKEDVPDIRNSKTILLIEKLQQYGIHVQVQDPFAYEEELFVHYGVTLTPSVTLKQADAVIVAVAHKQFIEHSWEGIQPMLKDNTGFVVDIKGCLDKSKKPSLVTHWNL